MRDSWSYQPIDLMKDLQHVTKTVHSPQDAEDAWKNLRHMARSFEDKRYEAPVGENILDVIYSSLKQLEKQGGGTDQSVTVFTDPETEYEIKAEINEMTRVSGMRKDILDSMHGSFRIAGFDIEVLVTEEIEGRKALLTESRTFPTTPADPFVLIENVLPGARVTIRVDGENNSIDVE